MIRSNTSSDAPVEPVYYLVQHIPDLIRQETRNVGVLVQKGDELAARFLGETAPGEVDGRSVSTFTNARVYKMWIRHWRESMAHIDWQRRIFDPTIPTFNFLPGGTVAETESDSAEKICSYLYGLLVSGGGLAEALLPHDNDDTPIVEIKSDLKSAFREFGIMKATASAQIRSPVTESWSIKGTKRFHDVTFCQVGSSQTVVMEPLDLTTTRKGLARDHARSIAYVFEDLDRAEGDRLRRFSIVRFRKADLENQLVKYSLDTLAEQSDVIDWENAGARRQFLQDRVDFAYHAN